jgi:DNA-binding MarR family transcriptional regulator
MTDAKFPDSAPQVLTMIKRYMRLRKYLRMDNPHTMRILADRIREMKRRHPGENPISPDAFYTIGMILTKQPEPVTMSELSRELDMPMSSATRIMDWMTKNGYAERFQDAADRRIVRVGLTEDGVAAYAALNNMILESTQRILKLYTPEEIETLHRLLAKAMDEIERLTGETGEA